MTNRKTFTAEEAAELLGVSASSVYRAVRENTFPIKAIKVGRGRVLIPSQPLMDLLTPNDDKEAA